MARSTGFARSLAAVAVLFLVVAGCTTTPQPAPATPVPNTIVYVAIFVPTARTVVDCRDAGELSVTAERDTWDADAEDGIVVRPVECGDDPGSVDVEVWSTKDGDEGRDAIDLRR